MFSFSPTTNQRKQKRARWNDDDDDNNNKDDDWDGLFRHIQNLDRNELRQKDPAVLVKYASDLAQLLDQVQCSIVEAKQQKEKDPSAIAKHTPPCEALRTIPLLSKHLDQVQQSGGKANKEEERSDDFSSIGNPPTEALRAIARSGYLAENDLGRFLLKSSKSIVQSLGRDYIFHLLLERRNETPLLSQIIPSVVEDKKNEALFRQLVHPPTVAARSLFGSIEPPTLNKDNTVFLISFWSQGKQLFSEQVPSSIFGGSSAVGLWHPQEQNAKAIRDVIEEEKLILKNFEFGQLSFAFLGDEHQQKKLVTLFGKNRRYLVMRLQCIRLDNNEICTLCDSRFTAFAYPGKSRFKSEHFLELTEKGKRMLARTYPKLDRFSFALGSMPQRNGRLGFRLSFQLLPSSAGLYFLDNEISPFHLLEELTGWTK